MILHLARTVIVLTLCLAVSFAQAAPRGREGGGREEGRNAAERKPEAGRNAPRGNEGAGNRNAAIGGQWSERSHHSGQGAGAAGGREAAAGRAGGGTGVNNAARNKQGNTGAEAAAGAAAKNRNNPQATGKQGAAAGAAAANRNNPQYSGAQGAAAGAAAANRNNPQYSGAQGAAAGAAAANRNNPQFSGAAGAAAGADAVRSSFNNPGLYNHDWYGAHPGVWAPRGWAAGAVWAPTTWGAVAGYAGMNATPMPYNYGNNVAYSNGNVMVNGQSAGSAAEYSQQAADLAESGATAEVANDDQWLPLGVFAMVRNEQQHPQLILQLAINKQGILRGNYTDEVTDHTQPIQGAVDPKTQRAAWTVGDNKSSVMEAGLANLAQGEAPALIHKNGKTDHWLLVRLDQPEGAQAGAGEPAGPQ